MASLLYFFWISITVSLGLIWVFKRAESKNFQAELIFPFTGWLLVVIPLGARLLHVIYEAPQVYLKDPLAFFYVWNGGFVYFGGLVAAWVFSILYFKTKTRAKTFWQTADLLTPVFSFGTGFGRIACFLQGCCYGMKWNGIWAIAGRHPTQLYMFFWEMILLAVIMKLEKQQTLKRSGQLFLVWIIASAAGRFVIEFYRTDFRGPDLLGLTVSQVIALGLIVAAILGFIRIRDK